MGDTDRRRFETLRFGEKRQFDDIAHVEAPDFLGKLDVVDSLLQAHFLDILDFDSFVHGKSYPTIRALVIAW
jgi:hypothetical protein